MYKSFVSFITLILRDRDSLQNIVLIWLIVQGYFRNVSDQFVLLVSSVSGDEYIETLEICLIDTAYHEKNFIYRTNRVHCLYFLGCSVSDWNYSKY